MATDPPPPPPPNQNNAKLLENFNWLLTSKTMDTMERSTFQSILDRKATDFELQGALKFLVNALHKHLCRIDRSEVLFFAQLNF
jgi:hypothetical protein